MLDPLKASTIDGPRHDHLVAVFAQDTGAPGEAGAREN